MRYGAARDRRPSEPCVAFPRTRLARRLCQRGGRAARRYWKSIDSGVWRVCRHHTPLSDKVPWLSALSDLRRGNRPLSLSRVSPRARTATGDEALPGSRPTRPNASAGRRKGSPMGVRPQWPASCRSDYRPSRRPESFRGTPLAFPYRPPPPGRYRRVKVSFLTSPADIPAAGTPPVTFLSYLPWREEIVSRSLRTLPPRIGHRRPADRVK